MYKKIVENLCNTVFIKYFQHFSCCVIKHQGTVISLMMCLMY